MNEVIDWYIGAESAIVTATTGEESLNNRLSDVPLLERRLRTGVAWPKQIHFEVNDASDKEILRATLRLMARGYHCAAVSVWLGDEEMTNHINNATDKWGLLGDHECRRSRKECEEDYLCGEGGGGQLFGHT